MDFNEISYTALC